MDKELIIQKFGLMHENGGWYSDRENSHRHLIVKDSFLRQTDTLGLLFRIHKLCSAKVKYFRKNIDKYDPCKYHYRNGFIPVPLWDAEFLKHRASGFILDFNFLQTVTVYEDFVSLCKELESYEFDDQPSP